MKRRTVFRLGGAAMATAALPRFAIGQSSAATTLKFIPQENLTSLGPVWTSAAVTANHGYAVYDTLYAVNSNCSRNRKWPKVTACPMTAGST